MKQADLDMLVLLVQRGDKEALNLLYRKCHVSFVRFAYRCCENEAVAKDVVQESWLHCMKSIRKIRHPGVFKSWMFRNIRWRTLDAIRKGKRFQQNNDSDDVDQMLAPTVEQNEARVKNGMSQSDDTRDIQKVLAQLSKLDREILHLFYLEELSLQQINAILEVPIGTIKSRLHNARTKFKLIYESEATHEY